MKIENIQGVRDILAAIEDKHKSGYRLSVMAIESACQIMDAQQRVIHEIADTLAKLQGNRAALSDTELRNMLARAQEWKAPLLPEGKE